MAEYVQYKFLETAPCLTASELADRLHIPREKFREVIETLVYDRQVFDSLHYFVNTLAAFQRHLSDDGKSVEPPADLNVLCVKDCPAAGLKVGDKATLPYESAVALSRDKYVVIL